MSSQVILVIEESPRSGLWNMAIDETLLEASLASGDCFVRLYEWSEATVSIGYFQDRSQKAIDSRLAQLPCVRRLSGGGAILHHHEQTYSCCVPPGHPLSEQPTQLYEQIHEAVIETLANHRVVLHPRGQTSKSATEPFLCFLREAAPDLVLEGHKVLGSAQRRRKGAVLQHGSLLLRRSEQVPEIPGLCDLDTGLTWNPKICRELGVLLAERLGNKVTLGELSADLILAASRRLDHMDCNTCQTA